MKTTKEMIEVMQAYDRGEQIEGRRRVCGVDDSGWLEARNPLWDWRSCDYRVKPKKKFVPFDTAEEFLAAQRKYGKTVRCKENNYLFRSYVNECGDIALVNAAGHSITEDIDDIHVRYEFLDGTPCGKEVEV